MTSIQSNNAGMIGRILSGQSAIASHPLQSPFKLNTPFHKMKLETPALSDLSLMLQLLRAPALAAKPGAAIQTLIGLVLDESGSMDTGCKQTMDGYNEQIATVRANAEQIGCLVTQINFHSEAYLVTENANASQILPLSSETYCPGGGTSLYDTVAATVRHLLSNPLSQYENVSILLTITTDGDDQSSSVWKTGRMDELRELMRAVNANDRWTVALAGPDSHLRQFADLMDVARENVASFVPASVQSRGIAMAASTQGMSNYVSSRAMGIKKSEMLYAGTMANISAQALMDDKS